MNSMNVARIARAHKVGSVGALLNHEPPPLTRNHAKENVKQLRELQRKKRDSKMEDEARAVASARPFKMKQFECAAARVYEERGSSAGEASPCAPKREEFLRKAEGRMVQPKMPEEGVRQPQRHIAQEPPKAAVPRAAEAAPRPAADPRRSEDSTHFLRANRQAAIASRAGAGYAGGKENRQKSDSELVADRIKKIHGDAAFRRDQTNVPAYLAERKGEMAEDKKERERAAQALREKLPDGYRMMAEDERLETLEALGAKKKELDVAFNKLPMKIETEPQKKRQRDALQALKEVEEALKLFSKEKVYVQL